jgi:uncharacterized membrane protein YqhA
MVKDVLASSRFFIAIAVMGAFLSSVVLILAGLFAVIRVTYKTFKHPFRIDVAEAKHLSVDLIQLIDVFLLGTVLYIVALGLYELFVGHDLPIPSWLQFRSFDDLEEKLITVIIVLLAVTFLGSATTSTGGKDIFYYGAAIGVVIIALGIFSIALARAHAKSGETPPDHG